ncbi:gliding motility-associated C-terminal domain-containing protein, partial [Flavobacterium ponti]
VTIPAGSLSVTVSIPITEDLIDEPDEVFNVVGTVISGNTSNTNPVGTVTIIDNDDTPMISIGSIVVNEGDGTAVVTVSLSGPSSVATVVDIVTTTGTAGTDDYTTTITQVTIPAGSLSVTVSIPITEDLIDEPDEVFNVVGTVISGNTSNTNPVGTVTIIDNDDTPMISIGSIVVNEGDGTAVVTVSLSGPSSVATVVDIVTTTGTAGTDDYTTTITQVTIPAGSLSVTVSIPITEDLIDEPDEVFNVVGTVISGNTSNTNPVGTVTIVDNDNVPELQISSDQVLEGDVLTFTVTLLNTTSSEDIELSFIYTNNNASDSDYDTTVVIITIPAGSTTGTFTIQTTNDGLVEDDETFDVDIVLISGNATILNTGLGIILNDDFAPIANDDGPKDTDMNNEIIINIFDNDLYIPTCGTINVIQPEHGTVVINDNGTPNDVSDDYVIYTPDADYYGSDSFTYQICDCFGNCSEYATVTINIGVVYPACEVQVFNAISPDGDGINDVLVIWGLDCHPDNTVQIFNRWGVEVYSTKAYGSNDNYFRGVSEGRVTVSQGEELPVGTYYYIIEYLDTNKNSRQQKTGYLYLNR